MDFTIFFTMLNGNVHAGAVKTAQRTRCLLAVSPNFLWKTV